MEKLLIVCLLCCISFQAIHGRKLTSVKGKNSLTGATVFGSVWCNSCLRESLRGSGIPNVTATIECGEFQATNITSELGFYQLEIPAEVAASSTKLATCKVKVANDFSKVEGELGTCSNPVKTSQLSLVPARGYRPFFVVGPFVFQPVEALSVCKQGFQFHVAPPTAEEPKAVPPPFVHPSPPEEEKPSPPTFIHPAPPVQQEKASPPLFFHPAPPEEEKPSPPFFVHPAPAPEEEKTSPPFVHPAPPEVKKASPPLPLHCPGGQCFDASKYPPFVHQNFPPQAAEYPAKFDIYPPVEYP